MVVGQDVGNYTQASGRLTLNNVKSYLNIMSTEMLPYVWELRASNLASSNSIPSFFLFCTPVQQILVYRSALGALNSQSYFPNKRYNKYGIQN